MSTTPNIPSVVSSDPSVEPGAEVPEAVPLAELQEAVLGEEDVAQYLEDLSAEAKGLVVRTKEAARAKFLASGLDLLRSGLLEKSLWGAQLRYVHQGVAWVDTLIVGPQGVKIVRMKG